jgi:transcriptional regulator with XRE-family HTH domain
MPEIGSSLREARMRAKIDISEVEAATKIRAKYLRAIENEEWDLLPGPTFTRSFLRTYAQYLGLDARVLLDEYRARYDRPSEAELPPISASPRRRERDRPRRPPPRWAVTGGVFLALLVALYVVGRSGNSGGGSKSTTTAHRAPAGRPAHRTTTPASTTPQATVATLELAAKGPVYVCLVDGAGRKLIPGLIFQAGQKIPVYHRALMRLTLGNNQVQMKVNGATVAVPASSRAIGYELSPSGQRPLPAGRLPTCT